MRGENLVNHLFVVANEITTDQTRLVMGMTIYQFVGDQQRRKQALELRARHARIFRLVRLLFRANRVMGWCFGLFPVRRSLDPNVGFSVPTINHRQTKATH